ncbi:phosphoribosyl-AMP cyclohydrolase [Micrococcus endophyticus]|uniref:Phosphoribosyl-AMP cyclohydrolase n=1 Tax=Micrococcus endophyticus TaxID=455343 RepID=A0A7W9JI08_9MICC|nr:phosphoribosyl-AMP cyclohydrolase [Micrococcus endophyticus]MBB5848227.1 phosphoribosyl-AMP cyclohydrolase [Micrococcus endophyticus]
MSTSSRHDLVASLAFDDRGLVPAIAQQEGTGEVLMMAWMNAESLRLTLETGWATYWSRSRGELWRKGETSGHLQRVLAVHADCDADTLLLTVDQTGPACHTGTRSCFTDRLLAEPAAPAGDQAGDQAEGAGR